MHSAFIQLCCQQSERGQINPWNGAVTCFKRTKSNGHIKEPWLTQYHHKGCPGKRGMDL